MAQGGRQGLQASAALSSREETREAPGGAPLLTEEAGQAGPARLPSDSSCTHVAQAAASSRSSRRRVLLLVHMKS